MSGSEAFDTLARTTCETFKVKKVYFARVLGRRLHYLGGFGEETYLPPEQVELGDGLRVFLEGADRLPAGKREAMLRELREAVRQVWQPYRNEEGRR